MFINDLPEKLSSNVKLFADDCIVYRKIAGSKDAGNLQKDLDMLALTEWQSRWQMKFNAKKCYVFKITYARTYDQKYTLNGTVLEETQECPYLGVTITANLTWNSHINQIVTKANKTLGFIRRNLFACSQNINIWPIRLWYGHVWNTTVLFGTLHK